MEIKMDHIIGKRSLLKKAGFYVFFFHDFGTHHLILLQSNLTQVTGTLVN